MSVADFGTVLRMATSLLNAAKWKNYLLASINASAQALIATDAAFLVTDIGKRIVIDGAGPSGHPLETVISAYTNPTTITVATAASVSVVGATVSYGGQLGDDRRNLAELNEAVYESDEDFYVPIAETIGHWARQDLLALSSSIANAGEIPHIGELGQVFIQTGPLDSYLPGKPAEFEEIQRMRANTGVAPLDSYGGKAHNVADSQIGGYFHVSEDGEYITYTGTDCKARRIPPYERSLNLQTNAVFMGPMASRVVARLLAKEGSKTPEQAQIHAAYSQSVIDGIRARAKTAPTLEQFEGRKA